MTKPIRLSVNLPFAGFYDSKWSGICDHEESEYIEYHGVNGDGDPDDAELRHPEELRLDDNELFDLLFRHTRYRIAKERIARAYVDAFTYVAKDSLDLVLPFEFEEMTSPRQYNFETDRLFATLPLATLAAMLKESKAEGHVTLRESIRERFTSYDGFCSSYDNSLESWLAKPLRDWDHNETGTLLRAILAKRLEAVGETESDFEWQCYEAVTDGDGGYEFWESAVDWPAFEAARDEARADKRAEWLELHPDEADALAALPLPPCPDTLDLFASLN